MEAPTPKIELATAVVPGNATIHRAFRFGPEDRFGWAIACGSSGTSGRRIIANPEGNPATVNCGRCKR